MLLLLLLLQTATATAADADDDGIIRIVKDAPGLTFLSVQLSSTAIFY